LGQAEIQIDSFSIVGWVTFSYLDLLRAENSLHQLPVGITLARLFPETEHKDSCRFQSNRIKADYVEAGGIVVSLGTDDDGWNSDWLPAPVTILNTGDYDLEVTDDGRQLFNEPNVVDANAVTMDERYAQIDSAYTILAWGVGTPDEAGAIQIERGQGMYVMASLDTRDATLGQAALPLMENMLIYAFALAEAGGAAVEPSSKLAATWGAIKQ